MDEWNGRIRVSVFGDIADGIATALTATTAVKAFGYVPERITPPVYIIAPGTPYIESGDVFGHFKGRFTVDVVSQTAANDTSTEKLNLMIEDALVTLVNNGISIESVGQPYSLEANNASYLAATIIINKQTSI